MGVFGDIVKSAKAEVARREEKRAIGGVPWQPWTDPYMRFGTGGPLHPSKSIYPMGGNVEGSLALSALFAGTKILASNAASLPVKIYQSDGNGGRSVYAGPSLFDHPSVEGTTSNFVFAAMVSLILTGEVWGIITGRDGFGFPTGIQWIPADRVTVEEAEDGNILNAKMYAYGRAMRWHGPDAEVVHIKAFPMPGKLAGLSLIRQNAVTLAHGKQAQEFGMEYFRAGGQAVQSFQNMEMQVDQEEAAQIRRMVTNAVRTHEALVFGRDWDYKVYPISADDAQFLQTMRVTATQIAALLDLPPERVGGDKGSGMNYSSPIQNQLQVTEALRPWLSTLESAFSEWLPSRRTVAFDVRRMLRLDPEAQARVWAIERDNGWRSSDEIRAESDLPPLPDGIGADALPITALSNMARGSGLIPKSWSHILEVAPVAAPAPQAATEGQPANDGNAQAA